MDIALHPNSSSNKWVYLAYDKPDGGDSGETVLARGTWDGTALVDMHNIFESGAMDTEASRIVFGHDGMLYMSMALEGRRKFNGPRIQTTTRERRTLFGGAVDSEHSLARAIPDFRAGSPATYCSRLRRPCDSMFMRTK